MELRQLTYFVAVVENGTVSGAAQALHMSQPPMTAQIHALEQELGCSLFEHSGRRLRLTDNGHAFYIRAKTILDQCKEAKFAMADLGAGATGILRLGIISSFSGPEFIRLIRDFHAENPGIRFEIREANTYQLLSMLRQRVVDLAIIRTPFSATDMVVQTLRTETLQAVGNEKFLAEVLNGSPVKLSNLQGQPILMYRRWEAIFRDYFLRQCVVPTIQCVSDSAATTLALARAGMGMAIVPSSAIADETTNGLSVHPIEEPELKSELDLVYLEGADLAAPAKLFADMLKRREGRTTKDR